MQTLLSGPESAALCGVSPVTVRNWKRRGLITPDGLDERGRPLYSQLTIARAEARTRQRASRAAA
ncbi:MerR family transcriptional regulator [Kitasatospora viridis]|uniref:MerR-like DNA binding protein n=1 Tax=Kitasatospora viridis TaxID=281105 RepID=A0A561UKP0_9ACTN|nr:MerR family transcriptional regulator [Kitasatospora viridis]TWF99927.1 MerR-like DNA binding protein [Kitasatospora viridis]